MTSFTVARKPFAAALAHAAELAPQHRVIPILGCALIESTAHGLFVTTTDTEMAYREQVDAVAREPWAGCADVVRLEAFVTGVAGDEIVSRADDEDRLRLSAGRASCRLPMLPADEFPRFSPPRDDIVELVFDDAPTFFAGLRGVVGAMGDEPARSYLCGAYLHAGKLCATDGNRLHLQTIAPDPPVAASIIIPSGAIKRLVVLLRDKPSCPLTVAVAPARVGFTLANWLLTSKVIDGIYPDYTRVLPARSPQPLVVKRKALRDATKLVAEIHEGDRTSHGLSLVVADAELVVAGLGDGTIASCEISIPLEGLPRARTGGEPRDRLSAVGWRTGLRTEYLRDAIDAIDAELIEIHALPDPMIALWLCAAGEAHDGAVIMPMRV